jgi:lipocalin
MNNSLIFLFLFFLCITDIYSLIEFGRCPNNPSKLTTLDLNRFSGKWYEVATSDKTDSLFDCTTMNIEASGSNTFTLAINAQRLDGKTITSVGKAEQKRNPLEFKISFTDNFFSELFKDDFQIIDTDYDKYAIIYTCGDFTTFRYENVWILLRSLENYRQQIKNFTYFIDNKFDIEEDDIHIIDHEDCNYPNVYNSMNNRNATNPESTN